MSSLLPPSLGEGLVRELFGAARVLHEDSEIFAIEKPAGVSAQPSSGDDAIARARALLVARGEVSPYLAVHASLDRDASGVLVLLKSREANAPFAKLVAEGRMEVVYTAAGDLAPGKPRGIEVLARKGRRVLVEARGAGKRPRAAMLEARLAIAGDVERGGSPGPRVLLHAREARFPHPKTGAPIVITSTLPHELTSWVDGQDGTVLPPDRAGLERAIRDAAVLRFSLPRAGDTTAFRLVHEAGDGLPGVAIDVYGGHAVLHLSSPEATEREAEIADVLVSLGFAGVYVKRRPKQASTLVDTRRDEVAPAHVVVGVDADDPLVVTEKGDRFLARLGDGLSTGIFLDQRENRALLKSLASGRSVLNLFAYACAFTVSAAAGGAARTVSVDIAKASLATGEENLALSGLADPARHRFVVDEARAFLARAKARRDAYDLVVLDPPSFATTKTARFSAEHDYVDLAAAAIAVLTPGGSLLACTNHRGIHAGKLRRFVKEAASLAGRKIEQLRSLPPPLDFPPPPGGESHLKSVLLTVR